MLQFTLAYFSLTSQIWRRNFGRENAPLDMQTHAQYQLTGIFSVLKNSSRASNEPSVDAWTNTPLSVNLIELRMSFRAFEISS